MELERLQNWLRTYPGWEEVTLVGSIELLPLECEEHWRKEDILGNLRLGVRHRFALSWRAAGNREANVKWLLDFQEWVQRQNALGYAPRFGDDPMLSRIQALQGTLKEGGQVCIYTVTLAVDFVKEYLR